VALTPHDRDLLRRCLHHEPGAWNDFVDRFLGLVYHVIRHTSDLRSFTLNEQDAEDIAAAILLQIVDDDYAVLRQFRGKSSLATYLTVIARRTCVHEMARRAAAGQVKRASVHPLLDDVEGDEPPPGKPMEALEEVAQLLKKLPEKERAVVRLYFLEGRTYEEISRELDLPMNSIGPILSRARKKMREGVGNPAPEGNPRKLRRETD
jgi:RNA polymerase sigma-70 factor (ECF subfamily)